MSQSFDVVVIGAGPGGYVAAIRCAQLGLKTAIVEREFLGGVCLNVGCIPSKAMISATHFLHRAEHDAAEMGIEIGKISVNMKKLQEWKSSVCDRMSSGVGQLLKGNQVQVIRGQAEFLQPQLLEVRSEQGTQQLTAKNFILATGSRPIQIPGFEFDEKTVLSSTGALALDKIPKSLAVVGGGYIGLEIGSFMSKLGTDVTVIEATDSILSGVVDPECAQVVARKLQKNKIKVVTKALAKSFKKSAEGVQISVDIQGQATQQIAAEKILVTVGRRPNSDQCGLSKIGISIDSKGFVQTNAQRRTSIPHIFAIGDLVGQPMLAHKASHEGVLVAEVIAGHNRAYDVKTVPAVVFTDPEIASAGMLESEARAKGMDILVNKFPFAANGRAVSLMETEGFVKMIADKKTHVLLGVHIVGPEASNLISEAALAIEMGARLEDLSLTIHPHPTLGETMMEAAEATLGHAIHILQKPLKTK